RRWECHMKVPVLSCVIVLVGLFAHAANAQTITLNSREYKVGLDVDRLPHEMTAAIEAIRNRLGVVKIIELQRKKQAQVQFFDTESCALRDSAMLLRARTRPGKEPRLTLKIRNPDLLAVDTMPVAFASPKSVGIEDDYGVGKSGKPASNFSRSFSFDGAIPKHLADLGSHIVNLE